MQASDREPFALAFSPGDQLLASMDYGLSIRLFQIGSGGDLKYSETGRWSPRPIPMLRAFESPVCEFSKDGKTIWTVFGRIDVRTIKGETNHSNDLGLYIDDGWIIRGRQRVLMIPREFRVSCAFAADDTINRA